YSLRFIYIFFGKLPDNLPRTPKEPPHWMRMPVELLVLTCVVVGVAPAFSIGPLLQSAVTSILGSATPEYSLAVWHGFNRPFLMSLVAFMGGVALYVVLRRQFDLLGRERVPFLHRFSGHGAYD